MTAPTDPRPPKRVKDSRAGKAKVEREGRCRVCGTRRGLNRAHLVAKGQRGDDVAANIVPLCGSGTAGCHGALTDHRRGWETVAGILRARLRPDELAYVLEKKGQDWLDRVYPEFKEAA